MLREPMKKLLSKRSLLVSCFVVLFIAGAVFTVEALAEKEITLVVDGKSQTHHTKAKTVQDFLTEAQISVVPEDEVQPDPSEKLEEGEVISLTRAVEVAISADWQTKTCKTTPKTVAEVLHEQNIALSANDWVKPSKDTVVTDGTTITINRINYVQREELIDIQPQEVWQNDNTLEKGTTKVLNQGNVGQDKVTYEITYCDGQPIGKTEVNRETVTVAEDKVIARGTLSVASRDGRQFQFRQALTVSATAYTHTGNRTATGTAPRVGTVAVDPSVIPLGSRLYVEGYGYAKAEDIGGAIKGNKIDVFLDSESACQRWGVKTTRVYILE